MMESYESNRSRLIVTADDFGANSRANRNILYLISLGKIDRVAVMIHGKFSTEEIDTLLRSRVKLDIHLDILHEFESTKKRSGAFKRISGFVLKVLSRKLASKKVARDWKNQIELFKKTFGKYPDGINSHEHVHLFPLFFKIALDLRDEFSIPYIRFGDSIFVRHHNIISHILHYLRKINLATVCRKRNCISSGSLVSLDWLEDVEAFLANLPDGTTEIACHPELAEDFVKVKKYF